MDNGKSSLGEIGMPPKEILKDLFKGSDKFVVSPIDSSEYSIIEKLDADSVFTIDPVGEIGPVGERVIDDEYVDYPYKVNLAEYKNGGKDILLAIRHGMRVTEPVHAIIDTEFITDDSTNLMRVVPKIKVNAKEMREAIEKLVWAYRHRKRRKLTYKTMRRRCAKRNKM